MSVPAEEGGVGGEEGLVTLREEKWLVEHGGEMQKDETQSLEERWAPISVEAPPL